MHPRPVTIGIIMGPESRDGSTNASAHGARTYLEVHINEHPTRLQLDTGAGITMISRKTWNNMGSLTQNSSAVLVKTADGPLLDRFPQHS